MSTQPQPTLIGLPDLKVDLVGDWRNNATIVNNTDRSIIGYALKLEDDSSGGPTINAVLHFARLARGMEGVGAGAKDTYPLYEGGMARAVHMYGTPVVFKRVSLDAVIFSNGEFAGPDTAHAFSLVAMRVDATREFALCALGDMAQIETTAKAYHGLPAKELVKALVQKVGTADEVKDRLLKSYTASSSPSASRRPVRRPTALVKSPNCGKRASKRTNDEAPITSAALASVAREELARPGGQRLTTCPRPRRCEN